MRAIVRNVSRSPAGLVCWLCLLTSLCFNLRAAGDGFDVILVVDQSGSMNDPGPQSSTPKQQDLKDAVDLFFQLWELQNNLDDRAGVVYFRNNVDSFVGSSGASLVPFLGESAAMRSDVQSQVAEEATAMGGGLQRAINLFNLLSDDSRRRHIVLFTDGLQNTNPMVQELAGEQCALQIANEMTDPGTGEDIPDSNVSPKIPPTWLDSSLGIRISVVGIGVPTAAEGLLSDIATCTNGLNSLTNLPASPLEDPWYYLNQFVMNTLVTIFNDSSPQLVRSRYGRLKDGRANETIPLSQHDKSPIFVLVHKRGDELSLRVEKNGKDITAAGRIIRSGNRQLIHFAELPDREGIYQMKIRGERAEAPYFAAIVVDSKLKVTSSMGGHNVAGAGLQVIARLTADDRPVTNARVSAIVRRPRENLAKLLANADFRYKNGNLVKRSDRKLAILAKDPRVVERMEPITERLPLDHQGSGIYVAKLSADKTRIPGAYQCRIMVAGRDSNRGQYFRTISSSTVLGMDAPDLDASGVELAVVKGKEKDRTIRLSIRPTDRLGNPLGPDRSGQLKLYVDGQIVRHPAKDLKNGNYRFEIPVRGDPQLRLTFRGSPVLQGRMSQVQSGELLGDAGKHALFLPAWTIIPKTGINKAALALADTKDTRLAYVVIQYAKRLNSEEVEGYNKAGRRHLFKIPKNGWVVAMEPAQIYELKGDSNVRSVLTFRSVDKLTPALRSGKVSAKEGEVFEARVEFYEKLPAKQVRDLLRTHHIKWSDKRPAAYSQVGSGSLRNWQRLAEENAVRAIRETKGNAIR